MTNLPEFAGWRRADLLRRRFTGDEFGKPRLDGIEALAQRVIFRIRNLRRIFLVIGLVVAFDLKRQPFVLDLGLGPGESGDVGQLLL